MEYKITLKNTLAHFKKICVHKYWVAKYCFKAGLYWQGLTHDMSKFSWIEFWESVKYYQGTSSPINVAKQDIGYSLAWQHHKGRNPHHYEYWTDKYDDGTVALDMPYKYAVELLCDWFGAARAYLGDKFTYAKELDWWINKRENTHPKMNEHTINFVDIVFHILAKREGAGLDPTEIFSDGCTLEYYFKIARQGDYNDWKEVERKLKERADEENKRNENAKIKIHHVAAGIF